MGEELTAEREDHVGYITINPELVNLVAGAAMEKRLVFEDCCLYLQHTISFKD